MPHEILDSIGRGETPDTTRALAMLAAAVVEIKADARYAAMASERLEERVGTIERLIRSLTRKIQSVELAWAKTSRPSHGTSWVKDIVTLIPAVGTLVLMLLAGVLALFGRHQEANTLLHALPRPDGGP